MGVNLKYFIVKKEISLSDLRGKILVIDAYNNLYQYLTTIRSIDGSVLTDKQGHVTSHLIGLFSRTTTLMEQGLKVAFVFDGKAPEIKHKTWEKRTAIKQEASLKLKVAEEAGDVGEMRKYAARTAILTKEMVADAKEVITALGLPIIQAPSEGEAQTSYMVKNGDAYASVSQDYDNLIFGCPLLIRNLSLEGKRKKAGKLAYTIVKPELISLKDVLAELQVDLEQLIVIALLIGTDYNPGGIKGIGPKTALKLVKEYKHDFDSLFQNVQWDTFNPEVSWKELRDTIRNIPITDNYALEWKPLHEQKLYHLLVEEHDFSEERVKKKIESLQQQAKAMAQKGLGSFF